jgi:HD-GYP domain-containing protein (c-di-GMP phosphodiesterase class II)
VCDYLQKPFDVVQVSAAVERALSRRKARTRLSSFLEELGDVVGRERDALAIVDDVHLSERMRERVSALFEQRAQGLEMSAAVLDRPRTMEFLEVLAETIETKDRFMRGHARRVAYYSSLMADRLDLSVKEHDHVRIAGFLHDLGKVGVPTDLLLRNGALTQPERAVVEQHPDIGSRLLKPLDIPVAISTAVRHHHEWWDGRGYPDGLSGDQIPLAARIIAVADAFDTMNADRPYRAALGRNAILAEFERLSGTQFDPRVVKEFLALLETGVGDAEPELLAELISEVRESATVGAAVN